MMLSKMFSALGSQLVGLRAYSIGEHLLYFCMVIILCLELILFRQLYVLLKYKCAFASLTACFHSL